MKRKTKKSIGEGRYKGKEGKKEWWRRKEGNGIHEGMRRGKEEEEKKRGTDKKTKQK